MPDQPLSLHATIELSTTIDEKHTRERCPVIHLLDRTGDTIASFPSDEEQPRLDAPDGSIRSIDLGHALSIAIDEEAWLREMHRVLAPGGQLRFIVPAGGPLAWLDARNAYRYAVDVLRRGDPPDDTLPTGWNRHYSRANIEDILGRARFEPLSIRRVGTGLPEIPQLAGLVVGNMIGGNRETERRLHPLRIRMEKRDDARTVPLVGSKFAVVASRR